MHLELDQSITPEKILETDNATEIESMIPGTIVEFREHLQEVFYKLEDLNIKFRLRRFLDILIKKLDETANKVLEEDEASSAMSDDSMGSQGTPRTHQ